MCAQRHRPPGDCRFLPTGTESSLGFLPPWKGACLSSHRRPACLPPGLFSTTRRPLTETAMLSVRIKLALLVFLSAADYGATWLLLRAEDGAVCESNPVACWWLDRHGWLGLAVFKTATVLVTSVLVVALSRLRPRASTRLLSFGCALLLGVVSYS